MKESTMIGEVVKTVKQNAANLNNNNLENINKDTRILNKNNVEDGAVMGIKAF